jgi:spermidine synthase
MSLLTFLYAAAIFLGSFLLFLIEPIAGKRLTPLLGGSAAVWITCLVYFQTALLLGYLCAHWLAARIRLGAKGKAAIYTAVLALALVQGCWAVQPDLHASTMHPITSVFLLLTILIGTPFVILSATNPLLQAWYALGYSGDGGMRAPYRLFALSNFGSLLALVIYPWWMEPRLSLREQSLIWLVGFVVFAIAVCGVLWTSAARVPSQARETTYEIYETAKPSLQDKSLWLLLPACGSLLLSAFTNHLSQNVAAIPLLWIVPLISYLLSFIWAFNGERYYPRYSMLGFLAVFLGSVAYMMTEPSMSMPITATVVFYCLALLIICVVLHGELYRLRPAPQHTTSYYLMISAGGALGAIFVGMLAPLVFRANYELVCGLMLTCVLILAVTWNSGVLARLLWTAAVIGMCVVLVLQARKYGKDAIVQLRNFYGTLRVTQEFEPPSGTYTRTLIHGTIQHGTQIFSEELRTSPTTYYATDSGVGMAIEYCCGNRRRRVGVVGLGAGTLAAYGRQGDVFRFYDINPLVPRLANSLFTYLKDSKAKTEIVMGDARLSLAAEEPQHYDVLVIDAFSGDAIPVHLLTREAIELYRRHLTPEGILAIHVSNQYLRLAPVVREQADQAKLKTAFIISEENEETGAYSSDWVLVTENEEFLNRDEVKKASTEIQAISGLRLWTDDYNSLLPLLKPQKFKWKDAGND